MTVANKQTDKQIRCKQTYMLDAWGLIPVKIRLTDNLQRQLSWFDGTKYSLHFFPRLEVSAWCPDVSDGAVPIPCSLAVCLNRHMFTIISWHLNNLFTFNYSFILCIKFLCNEIRPKLRHHFYRDKNVFFLSNWIQTLLCSLYKLIYIISWSFFLHCILVFFPIFSPGYSTCTILCKSSNNILPHSLVKCLWETVQWKAL